VLEGRLKPGLKVPASRALATALGVARITVVTAYDMLVAEGYFVVRAGAGTFVAEAPLARAATPTLRLEAPAQPAFSKLARPSIGPMYGSPPPRPVIDFAIGLPDVRQLRFDAWNRFAARAMRLYCRRNEGYDYVEGSPRLREAIGSHVSFSRAVAANKDNIIVTAGAQQAFSLLADAFVDPGQTTVAIEDPGYPLALEAFAAAGARVVGVPIDPEGLVVESIPKEAKIIYVTPSHQFPLGVVMSRRRRAELLEFALAHDAIIVEDDYDSEFRYSGRPLDALQTMDQHQRVFYVGTYSKCLFPAARMGFVVTPHWALGALIAAKQRADWHTNLLTQETLASFIQEGFLVRHVKRMKKVYAGRRELLLSILDKDFKPWLRAIPSDAGLHLTAMTAPEFSGVDLAKSARALGIGIYEVWPSAETPSADSCVLFGYGNIEEMEIRKALGSLKRLFSSGKLSVPRQGGRIDRLGKSSFGVPSSHGDAGV
jgi:GntR family transcriptional regulator/MocR family aminotransferase